MAQLPRWPLVVIVTLGALVSATPTLPASADDKRSDVPPPGSEPPRVPVDAVENRPIAPDHPLSATPDRANIPPEGRLPVEPPPPPELPLTDEDGNRLLRAGMVTESGSYRLVGSDSEFVIEIPVGAPPFTVHIVLQEGGDPADPDIGGGVTWVFVTDTEDSSIAFWIASGKEAFRYLAPGVDPEIGETFDRIAESLRKVE